MSLPEFKLLRPRTARRKRSRWLAQARAATFAILAGGTDLLPSMRQKLFEPQYVLDIRRIAELKGIRPQPDGGVEIGALTTLTAHRTFRRSCASTIRCCTEAAKTVASPVLRNMGTIGGNICLDTRCLWYNQSLQWRKSCGFCIKKDGDLCHVAPGGTQVLGGFLRRHSSGAALPGCGNRNCRARPALRRIPLRDFYTGIGDALSQAATQRTGHARVPAGIVGGLSRRLPQAAHSRID